MNRRQLLKTGPSGLVGLLSAPYLLGAPKPAPDPCTCTSIEEMIRLCCNENPYGPSPLAREAIQQSIRKGNRYPRRLHRSLKEQLAEYHSLSPDHFLIGSGSAQILQLIALWLGMEQKHILSADNTFAWMMKYAAQFGSQWTKVPLDENQYFDLPKLRQAASNHEGLVYLCNPNNPTGTYLGPERVEPFCRSIAARQPLLVDEAYIEYLEGGESESAIAWIKELPQLMVCRTFSKLYGMAGLRVGYLVAHPERIKELEALEAGFGMNVSATSLAAASASLKDEEFRQSSRIQTQSVRQFVQAQLEEWNVPMADASANFVFCNVDHIKGDLKAALKDENF
ncbi:MAG: histidinol-phosphate transaminase, partial [Bacteroidota bacterium]